MHVSNAISPCLSSVWKDETREKPDQEAQSVPLIQAKEVTSSQPQDSSGPEEAIGARSTVREKPAGRKEIIVGEHLSSESPTGIDDESKAYVGKIVSPNKTNKEISSNFTRFNAFSPQVEFLKNRSSLSQFVHFYEEKGTTIKI